MTESELLNIIECVLNDEFDAARSTGLIPSDADDTEISELYELNAELLYCLIDENPHLKRVLSETAKPDISRRLWSWLAADAPENAGFAVV